MSISRHRATQLDYLFACISTHQYKHLCSLYAIRQLYKLGQAWFPSDRREANHCLIESNPWGADDGSSVALPPWLPLLPALAAAPGLAAFSLGLLRGPRRWSRRASPATAARRRRRSSAPRGSGGGLVGEGAGCGGRGVFWGPSFPRPVRARQALGQAGGRQGGWP